MSIRLQSADIISLVILDVESAADFDGLRNNEIFARGAVYALHASGEIERNQYKKAIEHLATQAKSRRRELLGGLING